MHVNPSIAALLEKLNNPSLPGIDLSLERMWRLLAVLGNPQEKLAPVIHVAGTNGKGSTIAYLRAIYQAAGYRVHAYTSPHLVRFNERIVLAGQEIGDDALLRLLIRVNHHAESIPVTFFEATTAAALLAFSEHSADVVLLETGLGGRLDATNVVAAPAMTVLTPIAFDHMEFLGDSLTKIATEKAGILKADVPCIAGAQQPEAAQAIARAAYKLRAPLLSCGHGWNAAVTAKGIHVLLDTAQLTLPLPALSGAHQTHNAALAAVVAHSCEALPVSPEEIAEGIAQARWPGRLQRLTQGPWVDAWQGDVFLDGGHNVHAAEALAQWALDGGQPVTLVCGMMARKDAQAFLAPLAGRIERLIAVPIAGEDCHTPEALAQAAGKAGIVNVTAVRMGDVLPLLQGAGGGTLLIAGSLFLAGEILQNHG